MDNHRAQYIHSLAEQARKELKGSTIYGVPIDIDNIEHVLAALMVQKRIHPEDAHRPGWMYRRQVAREER